jgi:pimeloyl-ACP methyl ester carboxylesterase
VVRSRLFALRPPSFALRWLLLGRDAPKELVLDFQETLAAVRPEVVAARVREVLAVRSDDLLRQCPVPILYLAGSQDRLVGPRVVRHMKALRPDMSVVTLDAPHLVLQRRPVEAAREIGQFLAAVAP